MQHGLANVANLPSDEAAENWDGTGFFYQAMRSRAAIGRIAL
jgi:hypothetical protein